MTSSVDLMMTPFDTNDKVIKPHLAHSMASGKNVHNVWKACILVPINGTGK